MHPINQSDIEVLFTEAHTHSVWLDKPVDNALLEKAFDLAKMCPTSANCSPMRIVFVRSPEAKEKLKPCLAAGNVDKVMTAPASAIIGMDMEFYEKLPTLFPHADARSWFVGNEKMIHDTAFRNSSLQGAYFLLALRAVGLDTGAISGFDNAKVDAAFFAGTKTKSNFIVNIGYGDESKLHPRNPRMSFAEACSII
jgi:3-hydroxypropanoate dehydrogenase